MLGIAGFKSNIAQAFLGLEPTGFQFKTARLDYLELDCDRYLICSGVLHGEPVAVMDEAALDETFKVNFSDVVKFCDVLFEVNAYAKVCVIGSESAVKGSFDMAYAGAKAALHLYVESKRLRTEHQHLVCVSPTIIEDSGMTTRRHDLSDVLLRGEKRRMKRWLQAEEVARVAHFALNERALSNTVIHITGGNW
jgi:NAD(P)-dependent dehydrogenase (short-subunit alcohol dehydrogenase family)